VELLKSWQQVAPNYGQARVLYNLMMKKTIKLNNRITIKTAATRKYTDVLKVIRPTVPKLSFTLYPIRIDDRIYSSGFKTILALV